MLSWRDVRTAGQSARDGYNVVMHEFAHVLDMADGISDGVPVLPADIPVREWTHTLQTALHSLQSRVENGEPTALDAYGAQGPDEFFAVASEAFFVAPALLRAEHPELYALFTRFYRQDPETEGARAAAAPSR